MHVMNNVCPVEDFDLVFNYNLMIFFLRSSTHTIHILYTMYSIHIKKKKLLMCYVRYVVYTYYSLHRNHWKSLDHVYEPRKLNQRKNWQYIIFECFLKCITINCEIPKFLKNVFSIIYYQEVCWWTANCQRRVQY